MTVVGVISVLNTEHEACSVIGPAPTCVRAWLCVGVCARAFKTNVTVFPVLFLFWLKIEKPGEGERKGGSGGRALNCAACGVRLYILFYLKKENKENNNKNTNTLISGGILCHGSSKPLKGVSTRPHFLLLPDPSSV